MNKPRFAACYAYEVRRSEIPAWVRIHNFEGDKERDAATFWTRSRFGEQSIDEPVSVSVKDTLTGRVTYWQVSEAGTVQLHAYGDVHEGI